MRAGTSTSHLHDHLAQLNLEDLAHLYSAWWDLRRQVLRVEPGCAFDELLEAVERDLLRVGVELNVDLFTELGAEGGWDEVPQLKAGDERPDF